MTLKLNDTYINLITEIITKITTKNKNILVGYSPENYELAKTKIKASNN